MSHVIAMRKPLRFPPESTAVPGVGLRNFRGQPDTDHWLRLRDEAGFDGATRSPRRWTERDFQREFVSKWWWDPARMWLAEASGDHGMDRRPAEQADASQRAIIGTITLGMRGSADSDQPVVHWLMVSPRWRRRGVGRLLLATLEHECWKLGYRQLDLETLRDWTAAVAFYRAMGFVPRVSDSA